MPKVVFILGAGASAQGGCPVMATFFNSLRSLYERGELGGLEQDYQLLDAVRRTLLMARAKTEIDVNNLEVVFNALEMAETLGSLGSLRPIVIPDAKRSLVRLIGAVLERTQQFQASDVPDDEVDSGTLDDATRHLPRLEGSKIVGPQGLDLLARFTRSMLAQSPRNEVSFLTFNYDCGLELSLRTRGITFDYGLDDKETPPGTVPVFKLHGSLNWYAAAHRTIADMSATTAESFERYGKRVSVATASEPARFIYPLSEQRRAGDYAALDPLIVPPSENKAGDRRRLAQIWKRAAERLGEASVIVVIGYSMPITDEFFRQFFTVSLANDTELRRMFVIDRAGDPGGRFGQLIGAPIRDRLSSFSSDMVQGLTGFIAEWRYCSGIF